MTVGGLNPCPTQVGGGPTETEKVYSAMRRAVGVGGSARDDAGIDGLWRKSRAAGIAAAGSSSVRAANQFWPHLATDALDYYGRAVGTIRAVGESEADYRDRIVADWVARVQADIPHLQSQLQSIDPRISILNPDRTTTTQAGRAFGPLWPAGETPTFGIGCSIAPNYSTDFVLFVQFDLGYAGTPLPPDQRIMEQVKGVLRAVLPSWQAFFIVTDVGFILDTSPLDITGFGA